MHIIIFFIHVPPSFHFHLISADVYWLEGGTTCQSHDIKAIVNHNHPKEQSSPALHWNCMFHYNFLGYFMQEMFS